MRSRTQLLIAFFSAMLVTLVAVSDMRRSSPGGLAAVHGRLDELSGRNDCSECHGGLFGTLKQACLDCHEPIERQLAETSGLHGTLGARAEQCGLCHSEHHGEGAPLVHEQSFALAGVSDWRAFDHARIGFVLDGAHAALDCTECHAHASTPILPPGAQRFLGLDRDCASCHEDPHAGEYAAVACASCHGQETWDGLASLGHERVLPLVGGHAGLACAECHAEDGSHALAFLGALGERPAARECSACHDSPHAPAFERGNALLAQLPAGQACVTCHVAEHASFRHEDLLGLTPEQHAHSGFPLAPPHDVQACAECHDPERKRFRRRHPLRSPEACSACHEDVHAGQFADGPFAGQECSACHEPLRFEPHAFGLEEHARAALPLDGAHVDVACAECHARPAEPPDAPRVFRPTPAECDACHADAHDGFFARCVEDQPAPEHGECARCHDTASFAAAEVGFDHEAFTGFPITGAHAEGACAACHVPRAEPDAAGRVFGRVAERFGEFEGCASCHADPHGGVFDSARLPATVENRADCARCHVESSFRALPRAFEHGFWTGFALSGAHAEASCAACHAPLPAPDALGRTLAVAAGAECADCHEDPHAGQFADEFGRSDCRRCHDSRPADFLAFDHERDARFALGEAHRDLACDACHPQSAEAGLAFVRYRPLGRECTDCHGSNAEVLLRKKPRRK